MAADSNDEVLGEIVGRGVVKPEWIDYNGHMNVAYYVLAFDHAVDELWAHIGITNDYIDKTRGSTFAVECHITYQRELLPDAPYVVTAQLLAYDAKRIHQFQRMYHAQEKFLAATAEWMNLHVDLNVRKVTPWPESVIANLGGIAGRQAGSPYPEEAGRRMRIREPIYTLEPAGRTST
ncbi:MAG: thioesterase family protein [Gammaproteobacteria bacterium]|nr:thioesterase family protein [Gammaproteobacteria bacterium]MDH5310800.1 thioesterase family protein [Gammaproteobacteria bacterium]